MSAQKLKQLFTSEKFSECADFALQILQKNNKDKVALLFLAQAQLKLGALEECQNNLNLVYSLVKKGQDDALLFTAYLTQEQLAVKLQEQPQKQLKSTGRQIQISNKYKIIDFLDQNKKYDKMISETDIYCLLLLEDGRYKEVEDTYLWLMDHLGLSIQQRVDYGCRIFEIDPFYNPFSKIDVIFQKLIRLAPQNDSLKGLALKMLESLEKQGGKKSIGTALQGQAENIQQFKDFCEQIKIVGQYAFTSTEMIFKTKSTVKMFTRYLSVGALTTVFLSDDWVKFENRIQQLLQTDYCLKTIGDLDQNPLQIFLFSFLDVSKFTREGRLPQFSELQISNLQLINLPDVLDNFSREFQEFSLFANAYYTLIATSINCPIQFNAASISAKISQAMFLQRKTQYYKFTPKRDVSDINIFLGCLQLKINLDQETLSLNLVQNDILFDKNKHNCSKQISDLYLAITAGHKWQANLSSGKWLQAIEDLDELARIQPDKAQLAVVKKSEIQICHLNEICGIDQADQDLFVQGVMNSIQNFDSQEADNLLLQGYLFWTQQRLFQVDIKAAQNKWLLALKKDQTNSEIYYSLGLYYFTINDYKRATGCLEKALKLDPSFEQALVLQFYLLDNTESRLALVDRFMESNKNVAVTYFFKGLIMQKSQDFIQAIEMYQNAIKFYTIQKSKISTKHLLIPKVELSIHQNPFGIYGEANAAICWVYLSECFMKIEKSQVALKCFMQGVEEISRVQLNQISEITEEINELLQICNLACFEPIQDDQEIDPILPLLQQLQPTKWALECLILGSRLVTSPQISIKILNVALKCDPSQDILAYILTELLTRITSLVEIGVNFENGQIILLPATTQVIEGLDKIIDFVDKRPEFIKFQNLQKQRLNAIFIIAKRTLSQDRYKQALDAATTIFNSLNEGYAQFSFILDYAKIIHEYQRYDDSDLTLQDKKIKLIKKAISLDPTKADLWLHLHLFSNDEFVRTRAIFKAYELEPENIFVQETILKLYLQTKQWKKAFKIIVRSYLRAANANEPQQPIILATLAYFNAVCYFQYGQRAQLLEALSLIRLIEREDMKQLLSELYVYLSHYKGDYTETLTFLESKPKNAEIDLLLIKAYFGTSTYSYEQVKSKVDSLDLANNLLQKVFEIENLSNEELIQLCQNEIANFVEQPAEVAAMLALHQELCLKRKILPNQNLLDDPDVKPALQKLDQKQQRIILIQSLRLLQLRDGIIKEAKQIQEAPKTKNKKNSLNESEQLNEIPDTNQNYTEFIVQAANLKPQKLSTTQHKSLLRTYLAAQQDPSSLTGLFIDSTTNLADQARNQGLKIILKQRIQSADNGLEQLTLDPLSIEANTKWLWSLLRQGQITETLQGLKSVQERLSSGELQGDQTQFVKLNNFVTSLTTNEAVQLDKRLLLISKLCKDVLGSEKIKEVNVRVVACRIVKSLKKVQDSHLTQMIQVVFKTLQLVLFEQGHYLTYNTLVKDILNFAKVASLKPFAVNLIWHYQLLNSGSALLQLKKITQVIPLCKEIELVSRQGVVTRALLPIQILKARAQLALKNYQLLHQALNIDDSILERDFLIALSQYASQDYKQYYLVCLGLVAGAKTAEVSNWHLAYAYYLKAFAEITFLIAKRSGIQLKDDFTKEDGDYGVEFFETKAKTSLTKCIQNLLKSGEGEGLLSQAVNVMLKQI